MKRPKLRPGTFLSIPLPDGTFGYARSLNEPYIAFYNYRSSTPNSDLDAIASTAILFTQVVRERDLKRWPRIGHRELEPELTRPVVSFMQDLADFRKCTIFDSAGNTRDATPEECVGLERSAVWDARHIEERLLDTFMGRPNVAEQHLRVRLS